MKAVVLALISSLLFSSTPCRSDCDNDIMSIVHRTSSTFVRLDANTVGIVGDFFSATISCKGALPAAHVSTLDEQLPDGFFELVSIAGEAATGVPRKIFFLPAQDCYRKSQKSKKAEIVAVDEVVVFCGPENLFVVARRPRL